MIIPAFFRRRSPKSRMQLQRVTRYALAGAMAAGLSPAIVRSQDVLTGEPASAKPSESEEGFVPLLGDNAKELWRGYKDEAWPEGWGLFDEMLIRTEGGGDIMTREQYRNFDLRLEWRIAPGGNSGIIYRAQTGDPQPYYTGLEYQLLDNDEHADGQSSLTSTASLYALYAPDPNPVKPAGEWNSTRIVVDGNRIRHFLNGEQVVECMIGSDDWNKRLAASKFADWKRFAKADKGYITFQDHGHEVAFRNVRIKRLKENPAAE